MSPFGKLNLNDLVHSVLVAVILAIGKATQAMISNNGLHFTKADLQSIVSLALSTAIGVLVVRLASDADGKPLGISLRRDK